MLKRKTVETHWHTKATPSSPRLSGQNPLFSHTLSIAFMLLLIAVVVSALNTLRDDYASFIGKNEISQVCLIMKSGIEKIVTEDRYISPSNATKGRIFVRLPDRIADQSYRVRAVNGSLFVETLSLPKINSTCRPGFNLTYSVSASGGRTEINVTQRDTGEKIVSVKKV